LSPDSWIQDPGAPACFISSAVSLDLKGVKVSYFKEEFEDAVGIKWTKRIMVAVAVLAVYIAISFFSGIWPFSVASGLAKAVVNEKAIIHNYEWFYDQFSSIVAQEANVAAMEGTPEQPPMIMVLNNAIAEYNSKSRMAMTRTLWKADDLPYQIPFYTRTTRSPE